MGYGMREWGLTLAQNDRAEGRGCGGGVPAPPHAAPHGGQKGPSGVACPAFMFPVQRHRRKSLGHLGIAEQLKGMASGGGADVYIRCGLSQDQEAEWARQRLDPPTRVGDFRLGVEITQALGHTPDQVVCWGWGPSYPAQPFRVPLCACFHS